MMNASYVLTCIIKKHDNMHYIDKNYVLQPIYNDENECINDTFSYMIVLCRYEKLKIFLITSQKNLFG